MFLAGIFIIYLSKYNNEPTQENLIELQKEEVSRKYFDAKFNQYAEINGFNANYLSQLDAPEDINFNCLKANIDSFERNCEKLSDYALKHVRIIANICNLHEEPYYIILF